LLFLSANLRASLEEFIEVKNVRKQLKPLLIRALFARFTAETCLGEASSAAAKI
jgi:hypothetical protein